MNAARAGRSTPVSRSRGERLDHTPVVGQLRDRSAVEDLTLDRTALQGRPLDLAEVIEPGGEERVERRRQLVRGAVLGQQRGQLFEKERVAAGPLDNRDGELALPRQAGGELDRGRVAERLQRDDRRPVRVRLDELGPAEQQRRASLRRRSDPEGRRAPPAGPPPPTARRRRRAGTDAVVRPHRAGAGSPRRSRRRRTLPPSRRSPAPRARRRRRRRRARRSAPPPRRGSARRAARPPAARSRRSARR